MNTSRGTAGLCGRGKCTKHLPTQQSCLANATDSIDCLLDALLELDQESRRELEEVSLIGVRKAQLRAAAMLLEAGYSEASGFAGGAVTRPIAEGYQPIFGLELPLE